MAAHAARGDATEPEIIEDVLLSLCRPSGRGAAARSALEAHFSGDAVLSSALFRIEGRCEMFKFFRLWHIVFDDKTEVLDVAASGNRVLARIRHNLRPRLLNVSLPNFPNFPWLWPCVKRALTFPFIVNAEFTFVDTARGKRIVKWREDISIYSAIYAFPLAERLWSNHVERCGGWWASWLGYALDALAPTLDARITHMTGWKSGLADI